MRLLALTAWMWLAADGAEAQDRLAAAIARLEEADFEGATRLFDAAEELDSLTRDDLVSLYAGRAAAHLALGEEERMERDLRVLAVLQPDHRFGEEARPELREVFARLLAERPPPITVEVSARAADGGVLIESHVYGDEVGLVRRCHVEARPAGGGWIAIDGERLLLPASAPAVIEYHAAALGPGGARIAQAGSAESPRRFELGGGSAIPIEPDHGPVTRLEEDDGPNLVPLWVSLGIVGAVAVGLLVGLLVTGGSSSRTQPGPPVLFPP